MDSLKSLCNAAIPVVKEVGAYIRSERASFTPSMIQSKGVRDLVSYVDQTAERMLVDKLSKLLPEAGFITEEKTASKTAPLSWVVDPLDGTTSYITGFPEYTSTIALAEGKKILLGITYDIPKNRCYFAWDKGGAFCDNEKISVKQNPSLNQALMIAGIPNNLAPYGSKYFDLIQTLHDKTLGIRAIGSAALEMAYVSCGFVDGFLEYGIHPWDIAAGYILVKEAGGKCTDFGGEENFLTPNVIAAGPIFNDFSKLTLEFLGNI